EVVAVSFKFSLSIEVEARIVIYPADEKHVCVVAHDEEVSRVRPVVALGGFRFVLGNRGHQNREATGNRVVAHPTAVIDRRSGRRRWPRRRRRCRWTSRVFLGVERKTETERGK